MYQMKEDEVLSLLQTLRQIRQKSGELIALLEHIAQLQNKDVSTKDIYNPDDYLELMGRHQSPPNSEREMARPIHNTSEKEAPNVG